MRTWLKIEDRISAGRWEKRDDCVCGLGVAKVVVVADIMTACGRYVKAGDEVRPR